MTQAAGRSDGFVEQDPVFTASPAFNITNTDITQWDAAYSHTFLTDNPHSVTATQADALKRDGSNANSDIDIGAFDFAANQIHGTTKWGLESLQSNNVYWTVEPRSLFGGVIQLPMLKASGIIGGSPSNAGGVAELLYIVGITGANPGLSFINGQENQLVSLDLDEITGEFIFGRSIGSGTQTIWNDDFTIVGSGNNPSLTVKAASGQTAEIVNITDNSDNTLFEITATGHYNNVDGMRTVTPEYGAGIGIQKFGENTPEHFNQAGWFDYTGGAEGENLFIKTSGDDFTQADADTGSHLLFTTGTNTGAMCEVKEFISATKVIVSGFGWDQDINSGGSSGNFLTIKHPTFVSGDGFKHEFSVGSSGEFEINSYSFTSDFVAKIMVDAAADGSDGALFRAFANGYSNVNSVTLDYISGDLGAGESGGAIGARIDVSQAISSDSTTRVAAYTAVVTNGTDVQTTAYTVLPGFTNALTVAGAEAEDPGYGYEVTLASVADRVNGTPQDGTAFLDSSSSNLDLFDNDDDYILIGSDAPFEVIEATLIVGSSKNIDAVFEYSTGNGTWAVLPISTDGTIGFQQSGQIAFTAPGGWAVGNEAESPADITSAYYVRITRTYAPPIVVLPNEDHFKIYADKEQGMKIYGSGAIQPTTLADVDAPDNTLYYSSTQAKLVYKDSGSVINDLY